MRLQKIVALTDDTGSTHKVVQERHPSKTYGGRFVILFTEAMKNAARRIRSVVTLKLLLILPDHLNFTDFRMVRTQALADELDTGSGNISTGMRELLDLGILEREGKGPRSTWRLSSDWGWNGSADQYHAFRTGRLKGKKPPGAHSHQSHNAYGAKSPPPGSPTKNTTGSRLVLPPANITDEAPLALFPIPRRPKASA